MKKLTLIIMRHGHATDDYADDFNRQLTNRGRIHVHDTADRIVAKGLVPGVIISSDAKRAAQTAEIMAEKTGCTHWMKEHFLYSSYTTDEFLACVARHAGDADTVLVVAHDPDISARANALSSSSPEGCCRFGLTTAAAIAVQCECDSWDTFSGGETVLGCPGANIDIL